MKRYHFSLPNLCIFTCQIFCWQSMNMFLYSSNNLGGSFSLSTVAFLIWCRFLNKNQRLQISWLAKELFTWIMSFGPQLSGQLISYKSLPWMFRPFWVGFPYNHYLLGWLLGGTGRYKLPENAARKPSMIHPPGHIQKTKKTVTSWWFQPIWKICVSNCIISPRNRVKMKKYLSCHHLAVAVPIPIGWRYWWSKRCPFKSR